jgi:DNA-binding GntR family transcriptional regulator
MGIKKVSNKPVPAESLQQRSTSDRIVDAISKGILRRQYVVGQRLIEADLMRDLGVSRSTVREALKILAANGVVELTHHRGAIIRALSAEDARELLEVLEVLTGLAARLAASKISAAANRLRFEAVAGPLIEPKAEQDLNLILDQRASFYQAMFDIADSRELNRVLPSSRAHLFRTQFYTYLTKPDLRAMIAEYRGITEAILAGDPVKAESRMRRHLQKTAERTLPHFRTPA